MHAYATAAHFNQVSTVQICGTCNEHSLFERPFLVFEWRRARVQTRTMMRSQNLAICFNAQRASFLSAPNLGAQSRLSGVGALERICVEGVLCSMVIVHRTLSSEMTCT